MKVLLESEEPAPAAATSPLPRRGSKGVDEGAPPIKFASSPASTFHEEMEAELATTSSTPQKPSVRPQTLAKIQDSIRPKATKRALHIVFDLDETLVFTSVGGKSVHKVSVILNGF